MTKQEIERARELANDSRKIDAELQAVRKSPYWGDRLPYIHKLNQEKTAIEKELFEIIMQE